MESSQIEALIKETISLDEIHVAVDGSHVSIIAVGDVFADLSRVKKQQVIYAPLKPSIESGELHAVSIKTYTPEEWARDKKLNMPL